MIITNIIIIGRGVLCMYYVHNILPRRSRFPPLIRERARAAHAINIFACSRARAFRVVSSVLMRAHIICARTHLPTRAAAARRCILAVRDLKITTRAFKCAPPSSTTPLHVNIISQAPDDRPSLVQSYPQQSAEPIQPVNQPSPCWRRHHSRATQIHQHQRTLPPPPHRAHRGHLNTDTQHNSASYTHKQCIIACVRARRAAIERSHANAKLCIFVAAGEISAACAAAKSHTDTSRPQSRPNTKG